MAAVIKVHTQHRITRLGKNHIGRIIGRYARMGLDVGKIRAEELFSALNGDRLHNVDLLAAAVVNGDRGILPRIYSSKLCRRPLIRLR